MIFNKDLYITVLLKVITQSPAKYRNRVCFWKLLKQFDRTILRPLIIMIDEIKAAKHSQFFLVINLHCILPKYRSAMDWKQKTTLVLHQSSLRSSALSTVVTEERHLPTRWPFWERQTARTALRTREHLWPKIILNIPPNSFSLNIPTYTWSITCFKSTWNYFNLYNNKKGKRQPNYRTWNKTAIAEKYFISIFVFLFYKWSLKVSIPYSL